MIPHEVVAPTPLASEGNSPFVGLKPFETAQAAFFFGREREIPLVINNLVGNSLTLLYAESGAGKSSLLNAGVAPEMARQTAREIERAGVPSHVLVLFREWQVEPLAALVRLIDQTLCDLLHLPYPEPPTPPEELTERVQQWYEAFGVQLLVILDQFEEFFLYPAAQEEGPGGFFYEFARLATTRGSGVHLMLSIREDALARLDRFEGHIPFLFDNLLRIEPLTKEAGRQAIVGPLDRYNTLRPADATPVTIRDATVETILTDVEEGKVALSGRVDRRKEESGGTRHIQAPYLQLVMEQLWQEEVERNHAAEIRLATYERMGRARQITGEHLDRILAGLTPGQQAVAAAMFRFLVTASGSKIAQSAEDLKAAVIEETEISAAEVGPKVDLVLERLSSGAARILKADSDGRGTTRYEIFHDVLGAAILDWRRAHEERAAQQGALARQEAEAASARQRIKQLSAVVVVVVLALVVAIALALFAFQQQGEARTAQAEANAKTIEAQDAEATAVAERTRAEAASEQARAAELQALGQVRQSQSLRLVNVAEQQLQEGNVLYGTILATEALTHSPSLEALSVVHQALSLPERVRLFLPHEGEIWSLVPSPDGHRLLTTATDGTMVVWDTGEGTRLSTMQHDDLVRDVQWDSAGSHILTASLDGTAGVWDVTTGERLLTLEHNGIVITARWDAEEERLFTASEDGTVGVWDATTGERLQTLRHGAALVSAQWDRVTRHILTASEDGTAGLWDAVSGERLLTLTHDGIVVVATWVGPEEEHILTASEDGLVVLWDTPTGAEHLRLPHEDGVGQAMSNPSGTRLLTVFGDSATVWDIRTGEERFTLRSPNGEIMTSAGWSADGRHLLTFSSQGAVVWDAEGGTERFLLQHRDILFKATWDRLGRHILTTSEDGTAVVWEIRTGGPEVTLQHQSGGVEAVWSADEQMLFSVARDGMVIVWDMAQRARPPTLQTGRVAVTAHWSPDERRVLTSTEDGTLGVWDAETGVRLLTLRHELWAQSAQWSADGSRILTASGDGTAVVWDATMGAPLLTLPHEGWVSQAQWSPDERLILTTSGDQTARVWDATSGEQRHLFAHQGWVEGGRWSTDGSRVLTLSDDGTTGVWNASTGERLFTLMHKDGAKARAWWRADGQQILTASDDGTVGVWDATTGEQLLTLSHAGPVLMAAWDKAGQQLLSASGDGTAGVWDATTGERRLTLPHFAAVSHAVWSPDERFILTASADHTVGVWEADTGELRVQLTHQAAIDAAQWSKDGKLILTLSQDNTVGVWEVESGERLLNATHPEDFTGIEWSADEQRILTGARDGHVGILVNDAGMLYQMACEEIPRFLSEEEWEHFLPSEAYRPTCPPYSRVIGEARSLALLGEYEIALTRLTALLATPAMLTPDNAPPFASTYPDLVADPAAYLKAFAVPALWGQGRALAEHGNVEEATLRFRAALALDPMFLDVDPVAFARQVAAEAIAQPAP